MPIENRQISFTLEEVLGAVTELLIHHGMLPPDRKIIGLRFSEPEGRIKGTLTVVVPGSDKPRNLPIYHDVLGAALIRLCRQAQIPMPRAARKQLVRKGDSLALHLSFDTTTVSTSEQATAKGKNDSPDEARSKINVLEGDPNLPDWWATMSRRMR